MAHRAKAQSIVGVTEKQEAGLRQGRVKGTNHRTGYRHRDETKRKTSIANKLFWALNPEKAIDRGAKCRGENHRLWKGGVALLNKSIRQMMENRRWMDGVKDRDNRRCVHCGSRDKIESHHIRPLGSLIRDLGIRSRDDARRYADELWDLTNGKTLCEACHYTEHGRRLAA